MIDIFYTQEKPGLYEFERKVTSLEEARSLSKTEHFWFIDTNNDYTDFDFWWKPNRYQQDFLHCFSNQWQRNGGVYYCPKYITDPVWHWQEAQRVTKKPSMENWYVPYEVEGFDFSWKPKYSSFSKYDDKPYIYVFGNQWYPPEVMPTAEYHTPGAEETKYVNEIRLKLKGDKTNWEIPEGVTDEDFDFSWKPEYTEETRYDNQPYIYQFSSQWQKDGGPRYVMPGATEVKYVDMLRTKVTHKRDIFFIDHGNARADYYFAKLKMQFPYIQRTRFVGTTLDTIRRCANKSNTDKFWVIGSETNYDNFDFTWHGSGWQESMNHVFMSQYGTWSETLLLNKYDLMNSGWCKTIFALPNLNFVKDQEARLLVEDKLNIIHYHGQDDLVTTLKEVRMTNNRAIICPKSMNIDPEEIIKKLDEWEMRNIVTISASGSSLLVPRQVQNYKLDNIFDFPSIIKSDYLAPEVDLDIVFISNGESVAESTYDHLLKSCNRKVIRVDGINNRTDALKEAARRSTTEWFFGINAKLQASNNFMWNWQPNYMRNPCHYIFTALNPINGLVYGHMAAVAYNKKLVLETDEVELDFTQSKPHEVVQMFSGVSLYNEEPLMAWRTAFREVSKLLYYQKMFHDRETDERVHGWRSKFEGVNAEWVKRGVHDAMENFYAVEGKLEELRKTYSWDWLNRLFQSKYKNLD